MLRIVLTSSILLLWSCENKEFPSDNSRFSRPEIDNNQTALGPIFDEAVRKVIAGYMDQAQLDQEVVESRLEELGEQISGFLENPTPSSMATVRKSWLDTHLAFEFTTLHRHFLTRLTKDEDLNLHRLEYQIDHWPILPGYVDYVDGYNDSGIVNDMNVFLDIETLKAQHGIFSIDEVSLGFHVLEFLIWGTNTSKSLNRETSDFLPIGNLSREQILAGVELNDLSNNRRRKFLRLANQALYDDFIIIKEIWESNSNQFKSIYNKKNGVELVTLLLDAIISMLNEEILARSLYPLLNGNISESFPSPYSDSSQTAVSSQISSVERLLVEGVKDEYSLDAILAIISADFQDLFFQNLGKSKECLVILFSTFEIPRNSNAAIQSEFEIVECINHLNNAVENLEQLKTSASNLI